MAATVSTPDIDQVVAGLGLSAIRGLLQESIVKASRLPVVFGDTDARLFADSLFVALENATALQILVDSSS